MADQVEEVKSKTDIVSLIGSYIDLKKAGRNYKALCPFHSEKTPSFMVSPELQIYKCFGCGAGGDAYNFLQEYEGMDFPEALKFLADRAGVKLKPIKGYKRGEKEKLYQINSLAKHFYKYILLKHKAGNRALNYLTHDRGLKESTINKFELGYSPDEPLALRKYLIDKKGFKISDLGKAGITYSRGSSTFDRFRGRVIFPLSDHRGNIVGFAGRILPGAKSDLAKYINTPETEVYHKSKLLYGLNITKADIKRSKLAIIMEGELDAISSWQAGIKNVVAIKGSALTQEQIKLLSRFTSKIVMALDADLAGDAAARRGIELAEKEGFDIRVARFKGYKDPDEAVRKNPKAFKKSVKNAVGVWDFIFETIFVRYKGKKENIESRISREVVPILSSIEDRIVQAHYIKKIASRMGVPEEAVAEQVDSKKKVQKDVPKVEIAKPQSKSRRELLEERLLTVVFKHEPKLILKAEMENVITTPIPKKIRQKFIEYMKKEDEFDPSDFAAFLPGELVTGYTDYVLKDVSGLDSDNQSELKREIGVIIHELKLIEAKAAMEEAIGKIKKFERQKNKKKLEDAKKEFGKASKAISELEEEEIRGIIL
jgi:DNA primase